MLAQSSSGPKARAGADSYPGSRLANELMEKFAALTGLESAGPPRRYLWTDAFAVCNVLGLYRDSGERRYLDLALRLVDRV
jgi:hypothetical protein